MRHLRWILLPTLLFMVGCDAAAIAYFMGQDDSGSDDGPLVATGTQVFEVWVASIPNASAANAQITALDASGGNPSTDTWTRVGPASASTEFGPLSNPPSFNAVLVQASSDRNYYLDSIEILGPGDVHQAYASGQAWASRVDFPERILGAPDASQAVTNASGTLHAVIFTVFSGPIHKFRINGQGVAQPPASGDTVGDGEVDTPGSQTPGGSATSPPPPAPSPGLIGGIINVPINIGGLIFLAQFDSTGEQVGEVQVASGVTASEGSQSAAVGSDGSIYVASTVGDGQVQVRKFGSDLSEGWSVNFSSGFGGDRVDANGLAVDSGGNVVVSGGRNSLLTGVNHWMARLNGAGAVIWEQNPNVDVGSPTYWRGVTTGNSGQIFAAGDVDPALLGGGANEVRTASFSAMGASIWSQVFAEPGSSSNLGRAVALGPSGGIVVGGYVGTSNQGRNGLLLRYSPSGAFSSVLAHNGPADADDEILDVAVDIHGNIYATGYETVAGQGENLWVRKYSSDGGTVWTRTYHGGFGNDRGVSLTLAGTNVAVAGYRTNGSNQRKFMLRVYAK